MAAPAQSDFSRNFVYLMCSLPVIDTTPNVDYFTRDEVKKMVREFKEKCEAGELDRVSQTANYLSSESVLTRNDC